MRPAALLFIAFVFSVATLAQDSGESTSAESASREDLLKELVVQDRGEVTVLEPSSKENGGAVIGYASGAVLVCSGSQRCTEFGGTPNIPVQRIAASRQGASEVVWVSYRQGALYRCANNQCGKFAWKDAH